MQTKGGTLAAILTQNRRKTNTKRYEKINFIIIAFKQFILFPE